MFTQTGTKLSVDSDATLSNIKLLLLSCKNSLIGDPYFGTSLRRFVFEPNNILLHDLIIDEIYLSIVTFIPQVHLKRSDIKLESKGTSIYATINCINKLDNMPNMYELELLKE